MADIFGVNKDNSTTSVLSFQHVFLKIGKKDKLEEIKLCQQANLNYQRQITPVMAVGVPTIFLSPQPGQGTLQVSRAIGSAQKLGKDLALDTTGCEILDFSLSTGTTNNSTTSTSGSNTQQCQAGGGGVTGKGMMSGYNFSVNVGGGVSVTDGCTLTVVDVAPSAN